MIIDDEKVPLGSFTYFISAIVPDVAWHPMGWLLIELNRYLIN